MEQAEAEARQALGNPTTRPLVWRCWVRFDCKKANIQRARVSDQPLRLILTCRCSNHTGNAYEFQGKPDLARKSFREALRLDPGTSTRG